MKVPPFSTRVLLVVTDSGQTTDNPPVSLSNEPKTTKKNNASLLVLSNLYKELIKTYLYTIKSSDWSTTRCWKSRYSFNPTFNLVVKKAATGLTHPPKSVDILTMYVRLPGPYCLESKKKMCPWTGGKISSARSQNSKSLGIHIYIYMSDIYLYIFFPILYIYTHTQK